MIKETMKKISKNILQAIAIMIYFVAINYVYIKIGGQNLQQGTKIISLIILLLSITTFEIAYHKDNGIIAINGIEILVLAIQSLTTWVTIARLKIDTNTYILISACTFTIYYVLKSMIIYTIDNRKYLNSLSDIHEIVMNEPIKKEAKKRKSEE